MITMHPSFNWTGHLFSKENDARSNRAGCTNTFLEGLK